MGTKKLKYLSAAIELNKYREEIFQSRYWLGTEELLSSKNGLLYHLGQD